jgi:REP element-mobilizing transposase RayT
MPRLPRVNIEGALYYITCRGIDNQSIFLSEEDYLAYLGLLAKYRKEYGFKLFSFVLLPNHLHLLIEIKKGITTSQVMHRVNSSYTKYFNGKYGRAGHLLQERYKSVVAEKTPYLAGVVTYIHKEPLRKNMCRELGEYRYSSYPLYTGAQLKAIDITEEITEVRAAIGPSLDYATFARDIPAATLAALEKDLHNKKFVGSEQFLEKIHARIENRALEALRTAEKKDFEPAAHNTGISLFGAGNRRFQAAGVALVVILSAVAVYQYRMNMRLVRKFNTAINVQETQFAQALRSEKEKVKKDLEEKYQADMVSYQAMARRLEQNKTEQLKQKPEKI